MGHVQHAVDARRGLLGQKKYAEAEPLLLKGLAGMKQREKTIPPIAKDRLAEAVERLVELYEVTGKKGEVAKWQAELRKFTEATRPAKKR